MVVGHKRNDRRDAELKVLFGNVQSIVNKVDELKVIMANEKPDIMALTETWTHDGIGDEILTMDGYELIAREDRNDTERGRGGGIMVYAMKDLSIRRIDQPTTFNQHVSMEIKNGSEDVKIHVVYRSPNSRRENDEELCNWVKGMSGSNVFVGDFNFPDIDWGNGTSGSRGCGFYEATEEVFLEQFVTTPTHNSGNVLDLILCNREEMVKEVKAEGRIGRSDHDMIGFKLCVNTIRNKNQ